MKKLLLLFAIILCFSLSACQTKYPYWDMKTNSIHNMEMNVTSIEELSTLEEYAPIIVQGWVENNPQRINQSGSDIRPIFKTISTLHITKVYHGDLKKGDAVSLIEDWYVENVDGEEILNIVNGYMPSNSQVEYIFFLGFDEGETDSNQKYVLPDSGVCRFPVIPKAHSANFSMPSDTDLYMTYVSDNYLSLYREVIEKYL